MEKIAKKKRSWAKKLLIGGGIVAVILAAVYWYLETEKYADTGTIHSDYTVNALDLIREFRENDSLANARYREKIVTVKGRVSELEAPDTSTVNVKFIDPATGDYAIFAFQDQSLDDAKTLKTGDSVSVKGSCSGASYSEILGTYFIPFKRSTLVKK